jgi:hypothetical protein
MDSPLMTPQAASPGVAWCRGAFMPADQASISPFDLGLRRAP